MSSRLDLRLRDFFQVYLRDQRAVSPNTIKSYRDTFKLLLAYLGSERRSSKPLAVQDLDAKTVLAFLRHLEDPVGGRGNCAQSRNLRLAALQCFFKYLSLHAPAVERQAGRIFAIPAKRVHPKAVESLDRKELEAVLAQPQTSRADGMRDLAILTFLYNTGARAQEAADARDGWFDFAGRTVSIIGKGQRQRITPLWPSTVRLLKLYRDDHRRKGAPAACGRFFVNQRGGAFTRFGIRTVVKKYLRLAARVCPSLARKRLSTHIRNYRNKRGMDFMHDVRDWIGGYPYESIRPRELDALLHPLGFVRVQASVKRRSGLFGSGCDEYLYRCASPS